MTLRNAMNQHRIFERSTSNVWSLYSKSWNFRRSYDSELLVDFWSGYVIDSKLVVKPRLRLVMSSECTLKIAIFQSSYVNFSLFLFFPHLQVQTPERCDHTECAHNHTNACVYWHVHKSCEKTKTRKWRQRDSSARGILRLRNVRASIVHSALHKLRYKSRSESCICEIATEV